MLPRIFCVFHSAMRPRPRDSEQERKRLVPPTSRALRESNAQLEDGGTSRSQVPIPAAVRTAAKCFSNAALSAMYSIVTTLGRRPASRKNTIQ